MMRQKVLLSEASSLTSREFVTVLGESGVDVGVLSWSSLPMSRFSRWCRRVHTVPAPSNDPVGYLRAADAIMRDGGYDALLPTHEQAWLFSAGFNLLRAAAPPVSEITSFDRVVSKIAFAETLDALGLPQPEWLRVDTSTDLGALGFPVWVKAAYSTAGRGVRKAHNITEACAAWAELDDGSSGVMIQRGAPGTYAQVQGVFARGRLVGAAVSEQLANGVGGSAAARLSANHPKAVAALEVLGSHLNWHGGIDLDYFHLDGEPQFIECNPRTVEPGNAYLAGVNLPKLLIELSDDAPLPRSPVIAKAGVRSRSTLAIGLGAAEKNRTRRAVLFAVTDALLGRPPLGHTTEVLTPALRDPRSVFSFLYAVGAVAISPRRIDGLAVDTVSGYGVAKGAIDTARVATR